jgi:hypothetical protein
VSVSLLLHVSRGADNRLSGTVRGRSGSDVRAFSGTLALMRVIEELVPPQPRDTESGASDSTQVRSTTTGPPGKSKERAWSVVGIS